MELEHIRREYMLGGLRRTHLLSNPIKQFQVWLSNALESNIHDPTAMTLATVSSCGMPSQRIVLLKYCDEKGLVFFTDYTSQKGKEIGQNPQANAHFPWHSLERQVSVQGVLEKVSREESRLYFLSRPRESQLAAWASSQSQVVESRQVLEDRYDELESAFASRSIEPPDNWGGYRLVPNYFEFWQGGARRLHDRFRYTFQNGQWHITRLAP